MQHYDRLRVFVFGLAAIDFGIDEIGLQITSPSIRNRRARRIGGFIVNSILFHRLSADSSSDLNHPNENPGQGQKQQDLYESAQSEESA